MEVMKMANRSLKSGISDKERERQKRSDAIFNSCVFLVLCIYIGAVIGGCAYRTDGTILSAINYLNANIPTAFFQIYPCEPLYLLFGLIAGACIAIVIMDKYIRNKGVVENAHGDAAFEENYKQYDKEFVIDPAIVEKEIGHKPKGYYNDDDGHKYVITEKVPQKVIDKCKLNTQIYSEKVSLSINGKWCQRNANALIFGASGAGKSRFFLSPNLLQANASYVITDPSGDVMQGFGAFLKEQGYIVKCLNVANMNRSCRFNPLYYIRSAKDIPVIANCLMENTKKGGGNSGGDDFWPKTTQALLCAIFGYLFEVEPIEKRNFYNALNLLRKAPVDENADETVETEFDRMFQLLGQKNPNSYAFNQYTTFKLAPTKTALSILISTAVLISTYVDIDDFNNLTYKDELELEKMGVAPYLDKNGKPMERVLRDQYGNPMLQAVTDKNGRPIVDKNGNTVMEERTVPYTMDEIRKDKDLLDRLQLDRDGNPVEGEPYKMAFFLCIPQGDTTYNWIVAMLYSVLFEKIYKAGETRQYDLNISNPELAIPVRFLIDECANIGKIPNLSEKLATCRKYRLSVVPIFQNYSQIIKVYGKEDANAIIGNCDTTLFLGGADPETLKIITGHMGKETIKTMTTNYGKSKGGGSTGSNYGQTGRDIMSAFQVEQMKNSECLVFIRAVRPFKDRKYPLQNHPNFKYSAEANRQDYRFTNPFNLEYNDEEIESIRMKSIDEDGFIEPKTVLSARGRAARNERIKKRIARVNEIEAEIAKRVEERRKPGQSSMQKSRLENTIQEYAKLLKAVADEAGSVDENDTQTVELVKEIDKKHRLGIYEEVKEEEQVFLFNADEETKTANEHKNDMSRSKEARKIVKAQDGYSIPSENIDDYSYVKSFNPTGTEFTSMLSKEDREKYQSYFEQEKNKRLEERRARMQEAKRNSNVSNNDAIKEAAIKEAEQMKLAAKAKEEAERSLKEKREKEAAEILAAKKAEEERLAEEQRKAEEAERRRKEQEEMKRQEELKRQEEERARKEEEERIRKALEEEERIRKEREAKEKEEAEKREKAIAEAKARAERAAAEEARKKAEAEAKQKAEEEAKKKAEAERLELERIMAEKRRLEEERAKAEKLEAERLEKERAEQVDEEDYFSKTEDLDALLGSFEKEEQYSEEDTFEFQVSNQEAENDDVVETEETASPVDDNDDDMLIPDFDDFEENKYDED